MHSMTGFGKSDVSIGNQQFSIEIKSVNHRYLDTRFRLPPLLSFLELSFSEVLRNQCERGSFEISIKQKAAVSTPSGSASQGTRYVVDELAAKSLIDGAETLHKKFGTEKTPSLDFLLSSGRVFLSVEEGADTTQLWEQLKKTFELSLSDLRKMRLAEGLRLKAILKSGAEELLKGAEQLAQLAPLQTKKVKEKLEARLEQWKLGSPIDSQRLEWEVALLAERSDITEEIDRLRTHAKEFITLLEAPKSVGRKLDFLTQELHREVNTTASKSTHIEITQLAVALKTQIEKLREQVQNVE